MYQEGDRPGGGAAEGETKNTEDDHRETERQAGDCVQGSKDMMIDLR